MAQITIGDVQLNSDGKTLTISRHDQPDLIMSLDAGGVEELIDFVTSLTDAESNRRQAFRVPLHGSSGLSVQIRKNENKLAVTPMNISVTGILVTLPPDNQLDLSQNDDLEVTLEFEGETQTYHAIVKRREGDGFGLFFPESMKDGQVDPPRQLSRMVMELQRRWMARRAKQV